MIKALSTLVFIGLFLYMPTYTWAQQKKASLLEEQLKEVNNLKNTNADSAFLVVSNLTSPK
ncbi:hypothetical protein [Pedobacter foliorum]|uniref:hypothetical protein n=1 Tax=Pedobacter foliorum TaxID=2739058 RepID=UPI001562FBF7|nr:hypothetical protein [Pedobacter foliorum]NRF38286.1 hypothetical protein [Pedobacter foliorum]